MNKIVNYCQLALRCGKTSTGSDLIPSIQNQKAKLVVYSSACGLNRKKKLKDKCAYYKIECIELNELFFNQITQKNIRSLAITDQKFAEMIMNIEKG